VSLLIPGPGQLADLAHLAAEVELREDTDARPLADELYTLIERRIMDHPRSQQVEIGPSEIGTSCARHLVYAMAATPQPRDRGAPWLPTVGTAMHDWLAEAVIAENQRLGWTRYLVEMRVDAGAITAYGDLQGSADLYDRLTASVVDWKLVGVSKLKEYRRNPRAEYRVQPHVYGRGFARRGLPVRRVVLMLLPRNGTTVREGVVWSEPYDERVALAAIGRAARVNALRLQLGLDVALRVTNGDLLAAGAPGAADPAGAPEDLAVPIADDCRYCPWLAAGSTDLTRACPGVTPGTTAMPVPRGAPPDPSAVMTGRDE
jgi:hypothetical protein